MILASSANVEAPNGGRSASIRPLLLVGVLIVFTLTIYYGSQMYIGWRFNARIELGLLDWGVWFDLLGRLPTLFQLELTFIGLGLFGFTIGVLRQLLGRWKRSKQKPRGIEDLYGSARWATRDEITAFGLLPTARRGVGSSIPAKPRQGVVVGGWQERPKKPLKFLKDDSKNHILVFAPTRAGKGVSIVMPTLLDSWRASALVYDPKGEAWALSARFRRDELGQRVYKFDPAGTGEDVAKFNPLAEIRIGTQHEVADCQTSHKSSATRMASALRANSSKKPQMRYSLHSCFTCVTLPKQAIVMQHSATSSVGLEIRGIRWIKNLRVS